MSDAPKNLSILLVDQDPFVCDLMKHFLEGSGHSVVTAHSLGEAVRASLACRVDLALLDPNLPGESPDQVLQRVVVDPGLKAIVLSESADRTFIMQSVKLGVKNFMLKSTLNCKTLMDKIDQTMCEPAAAN